MNQPFDVRKLSALAAIGGMRSGDEHFSGFWGMLRASRRGDVEGYSIGLAKQIALDTGENAPHFQEIRDKVSLASHADYLTGVVAIIDRIVPADFEPAFAHSEPVGAAVSRD